MIKRLLSYHGVKIAKSSVCLSVSLCTGSRSINMCLGTGRKASGLGFSSDGLYVSCFQVPSPS